MSGDDLRALAEAATPGPWEVWEQHGRDYTDEGWSQVGVKSSTRDVALTYPIGFEHDQHEADATFIAAADPTAVLALLDEVDRLRADIAEAEQRGREDNADHGMCYVSGSKALEAILDERDALRAAVERVRALADEWVKRDCEWSCESEMLDDLRVALEGPA